MFAALMVFTGLCLQKNKNNNNSKKNEQKTFKALFNDIKFEEIMLKVFADYYSGSFKGKLSPFIRIVIMLCEINVHEYVMINNCISLFNN